MSLRPTPGGEVPAATAAVARAAFPKGNHCLVLRDALGPIFEDEQFEGLFAACGRPAECPWRLALVTLLQFGPGSLGPPRCGCRARTHRLEVSPWSGVDRPRLRRLGAERAQALGWWPAGPRRCSSTPCSSSAGSVDCCASAAASATCSTHVLGAVRSLNRLDCAVESVRAALNALAVAAPDWLRAHANPAWTGRYAWATRTTSTCRGARLRAGPSPKGSGAMGTRFSPRS